MRSRLEARFAAALDDAGWLWEYEPRAFADGYVQYLPDFEVLTPDSSGRSFAEVKPTREAAYDAVKLVATIFASEPELKALMIAWPTADWAIRADWAILCVLRDGSTELARL